MGKRILLATMCAAVTLATSCRENHDATVGADAGVTDAGGASDAGGVDAGAMDGGDGAIIDAGPACDAGTTMFTVPITDPALLDRIVPLGSVSGNEIKPHTFLQWSDGGSRAIYAPIAAALTSIAYYNEGGLNQYLLEFQVNCAVRFRLDHVSDPIAAIRAVGPQDAGLTTAGASPTAPFYVDAGDLIATTTVWSFDHGVYNTAKVNVFGNNARYEWSGGTNYLNSDCPYDYYEAATKAAFYVKFGMFGMAAGGCGSCRSASQDVAGSLAGAWFLAPDGGTFGDRIAVTADCDKSVLIAGLGDQTIGAADAGDPATVTTEACYADSTRFAYLKVLSPSSIGIVFDAGVCPAGFPDAGYTIWYR
ncbi:MAG: hypothetical protein HYY84_05165 [Deltaproteobacteria bacterium]|nr:hypothetical protein [Deltaproteobacteria bacterium]